MTKRVWRNRLLYSRNEASAFDDGEDHSPREWSAISIDKSDVSSLGFDRPMGSFL